MSSIMQILRRIGGVKATPTSGSEGQLAMWKAGTAPTDATSLYAHDGVQWVELLDTSRNPRVIDVNDAVAGLRITQTGTGEALRVEDEANPDTTPFVVDTAGRVGIGTDAPAAKLHIDKTGTGTLLYVRNPAAPTNALFVVANNGHVGIGNNAGQYLLAVGTPDDQLTVDVVGYKVTATLGQPPSSGGGRATIEYDRSSGEVSFLNGNTAGPHHYLRVKGIGTLNFPTTYAVTGAGSALNITSGGDVVRSSSSIKYKKDIEPLDAAITDKAIRELRPVWYRSKKPMGDDKAEWSHIGLIAEDVAKVEPRLVNFKTVEVSSDDDGNPVVTPLETPEPEDVDYARLSVLLLDHVQRLEKRIAVLEARP